MSVRRGGSACSIKPRLLFAMTVLVMLACDSGDGSTNPPGIPVRLTVSPSALQVVVGDSSTFTAQAYDARNRPTSMVVEWTSANPAVATVGEHSGVVVAVAPGSTTIEAAAGTITATAIVSVRLPGPATNIVVVTPSTLAFGVSEKRRMIALATDVAGRPMSVAFTWSSANPAIATVGTTDGIVTGIASGGTLITVTTGTLAATAHVIVVGGAIAMTRWTIDVTSGTRVIGVDALVYPGADGTPRALPLPGTFLAIAAPSWSMNGMQLALEGVSSPIVENDDHYIVYQSDIIVLDPGASTWRVLTTGGRSQMPSWSPDGSRLAYVGGSDSGSHIYTISSSGGSPTRLASTSGVHSAPQWSPDGLRLTFAVNGDVHVVNVDGTGLINVTRSPAYDFDPSWSPDGARLVFASAPVGAGTAEVFSVALADPDRPIRLTDRIYGGSTGSPKWSPDGGQIAFTLGQTGTGGRSGIYVMNSDGSFPAQLVKAPPGSWANVSSWTR